MLPWIIKYWPYILIFALALGAFFYVRHLESAARKQGWDQCIAEQTKLDLEGVKIHDEIREDIRKLSDPDLDSRLSKWLRD